MGRFQIVLGKSAIFFPLAVSSLRDSGSLEKTETHYRLCQVPQGVGFGWCLVFTHVIPEMGTVGSD